MKNILCAAASIALVRPLVGDSLTLKGRRIRIIRVNEDSVTVWHEWRKHVDQFRKIALQEWPRLAERAKQQGARYWRKNGLHDRRCSWKNVQAEWSKHHIGDSTEKVEQRFGSVTANDEMTRPHNERK